MTTPVAPLQSLAQLIRQHEAELQRLRQQYESRQALLADLAQRKEELRAQIQQVDADIQAIRQGGETPAVPAPAQSSLAAQPVLKAPRDGSLSQLLLRIASEAGRPMTMKELTKEVVRRKYPTKSDNLNAIIQTRVRDLVTKGLFQQLADGGGVLPARPPANSRSIAAQSPNGTVAAGRPKGSAQKSARSPASGKRRDQPPLREVVADLLARSPRPLTAGELSEQALATGYQSKSKDFKNVIWVALGQMDNVERVEGRGWRLIER